MKTPRTLLFFLLAGCTAIFVVAGCSKDSAGSAQTGRQTIDMAIPPSLSPFGDGYPTKGDRCRRLGESAATSDFLDHEAILVGCPGGQRGSAAQSLIQEKGGQVVAEIDGVALISIPDETSLGP